MELTDSHQAGGAAMAGGQRFQAQVTAWWCARILLETPNGQRFDLPRNSTPWRIYCETADSIDDLRVEFSGNDRLFGQCKRSLSLSFGIESEWASVLKQFYNELERGQPGDAERRFVLFYEKPNSSLGTLSVILRRYRQLRAGTLLMDAAKNQQERSLVENLNALLDSLQENPELPNLSSRREEFLRHSYIYQLQLGLGEADYLSVVDALQDGLLINPQEWNQVLVSLHRLADDLLADRGSVDRLALRKRLLDEGVALRESINYRLDFERLNDHSTTEIASHEAEGRLRLSLAGDQVFISRAVVQEMLRAVEESSFLVVGGAGTGKTGCLLALAKQLRSAGRRVWYWAADALSYSSPQEIRTHLQLQHPWSGLLAEAACGFETVLIIDGLDGLRDTQAQRAYRRLIALAIRSRIRVVASIRSFDLQYAYELQETFPPLSEHLVSNSFLSDEFKKVGHIIVPEVDESELNQVITKFPILRRILEEVPQLNNVVYNLFNLDLLCKLISDGDSPSQLSSLSTQAELFERYWEKRVLSQQLRQEMTKALKKLIERMVNQQTLQVIPDEWSTQVKEALFSGDIVRHPQSVVGRLPEQQLVEFTHHLLFDYAAELLFIRPWHRILAVELANPDTWGLFLRPSLVLFHRYAWKHGRLDFWETLISLEQSSVPLLQKLPGYSVVADEALSREDLQPMLEGSLRDDTNSEHWIGITQGVTTAAAFSSHPKLFGKASGDWWIEFARDLISTSRSELVFTGRRILYSASDALDTVSAQARFLFNQAAIILIRFHWSKDTEPNLFVRSAISWVCRSIDSNLLASSEVIREILTQKELKRAGYIQASEIARHIKDLWKADPTLAVEVYDSIFGYVEIDQTATPMGSGQILSLISNRHQDYEAAYYQLSEDFSMFLSAHPKEATCALIRAVRHFWRQKHLQGKSPTIKTFKWNGHDCRIQSDYSSIWDRSSDRDAHTKMLTSWEDYIAKLPTDNQADEKWDSIVNVVMADNELAAVWRRLLLAGCRSPAFFAQRLWTLLINPVILINVDTHEAAEDCIEAFAPQLTTENIRQIESTIFNIKIDYSKDNDIEIVRRRLARVRARLLCCIPAERRSIHAEEFLDECDSELKQPRQPDYKFTTSMQTLTPEMLLAEQGIDIEKPKHKEILDISAFLENLSSNAVTDGNLKNILHSVYEVEQNLVKAQEEIEVSVKKVVEQRLIRGFAQIASSHSTLDQHLTNDLFERFRKTFLTEVDMPSLQHLAQFDEFQGWDSLNSKTNAVQGLISLVSKMEETSEVSKNILRRIAEDPEPVLRYRLGWNFWFLLNKWPEFVWETLERWIAELPKQPGTLGVLLGTLQRHWFWWLRNNDAERANKLLRNLLTAARLRDSTKLRNACGSWLAALCFFKDEAWACDALGNAIVNVRDNIDELEGAQRVAINEVLPRIPKELSQIKKNQRAMDFLLRLLRAANQSLEAYRTETINLPLSDRPTKPPVWVNRVAGFFDHVAIEFQFSAEGHVKHWMTAEQHEVDAQLAFWWETVELILETILTLPHPGIAFRYIKGLEQLVNFDVCSSLLWLRRVTLAGAPVGLANESLAADCTIGILERILSEHRGSLAEGQLRSDFVQILEEYLKVGWPKAMRLAFQLESIFR